MRADRRKYHYIYKITRTDGSGKYYIGMHSTDDLDDGYFGSGRLLWKSIKKHGKGAHTKEILEYLPTREALRRREKEIVSEEIVSDEKCLNLKLGGVGGLSTSEHRQKFFEEAKKNCRLNGAKGGASTVASKKGRFDPEMQKVWSAMGNIALKEKYPNGPFVGRTHTAESKALMSDRKKATPRIWVMNEEHSVMIEKVELEKYLSDGYIRGRKIKT